MSPNDTLADEPMRNLVVVDYGRGVYTARNVATSSRPLTPPLLAQTMRTACRCRRRAFLAAGAARTGIMFGCCCCCIADSALRCALCTCGMTCTCTCTCNYLCAIVTYFAFQAPWLGAARTSACSPCADVERTAGMRSALRPPHTAWLCVLHERQLLPSPDIREFTRAHSLHLIRHSHIFYTSPRQC